MSALRGLLFCLFSHFFLHLFSLLVPVSLLSVCYSLSSVSLVMSDGPCERWDRSERIFYPSDPCLPFIFLSQLDLSNSSAFYCCLAAGSWPMALLFLSTLLITAVCLTLLGVCQCICIFQYICCVMQNIKPSKLMFSLMLR